MPLGRRTLVAPAVRVLRVMLAVVTAACHRTAVPVMHADSSAPAMPTAEVTAPKPFSRIPRDAARFEIEVVDDTTARFKPREALWIRDGMTAYAVDPMNRDALVARLRIVSVWNETAVAVITSQVTRVTTRHVVLMTPPVVPWWKARRFWLGTAVGAFVGGVVGVIATP
ncbi:MAG: hypothetical protein IPP90_17835 [Gemmatimonadaceae bacterium]|nr:hypothetical protein [Gemmatimonadaceae bacterium]